MKKNYFLVSALLLAALTSRGQGTELFLSEYIEGAHQSGVSYNGGVSNSTGNERALEIFNPTTSAVSLNAYSVRRYSNGSATPIDEERLMRATGANTLNSAAAFVYVNGESTLTELTTKGNQRGGVPYNVNGPNYISQGGAPTGSVSYFNGDDALGLVRWTGGTAGVGSPVLVDIFGIIGNQPLPAGGGTGTGQWSGTNPADAPVIVNGVSVQPLVASANQSLMRRPSVSSGTRVNPAVATYNIADQWKAYSYAFPPGGTSNPGGQSYSRLGEHNDYTGPFGVYGPLKVLEKFNNGISVYPNPASGSATIELKDVKVGSIVILNSLGQSISVKPQGLTSEKITVDISSLKAGLYFVQFVSKDGQTKLYKELLVK
ncbi:T9SS type A sorting domain-containing protein [Hymenobacter psychrotolerans]|uniref:Por secretion system C-terminal sorting domain-containing protein n=1 Tax=Hymenobacter psychrotolerans DSM 18569 TaxID=1121959 RepID=A0A1M6XDK3_9BACT|nr:T9SS type A sorting domain-containing protein [Hymenobacter psychrotolerans]SHL03885.1 Por secretion system C-terminal sorting domain-containing protein [Hymenobacter psychrotolerans DSM 18569]